MSRNKYWAHIAHESSKVITFLDLCGHEKYLKTTMYGMVGLMPDYAMIVVGANMGMQTMTKEHLGLALVLEVPVFVIVTKIDIAPANVYTRTLENLCKIFKSKQLNKMPIVMKLDEDMTPYMAGVRGGSTVPIFSVSSVSGDGLPQL